MAAWEVCREERQGPDSWRQMETAQGASERGRVLCSAGPGGKGPSARRPGAHGADPPAAAAGGCAAPRPPDSPGLPPGQGPPSFPGPSPAPWCWCPQPAPPGQVAGGCGPHGWRWVGVSLQLGKPSWPQGWRNPLPSLGTQPSGRIPVSTWAPGERLPASRFPGAGGAVRHLVLSLNPVAMDSLGTGIQARPHGWRRGAHCCPTLGPSPAPPGAPRGPPPVPCQQVTASLRFGGGATPHLSRLLLPLSPQPVPHSGSSGYGSLGSNGSHEHLMSQTSSSDSAVQEDPRRRRAVRAPRSPSAHHL